MNKITPTCETCEWYVSGLCSRSFTSTYLCCEERQWSWVLSVILCKCGRTGRYWRQKLTNEEIIELCRHREEKETDDE